MTPTLHMSVVKPTGSKATTSGAMNSGVPYNTVTGVSGAAEKMETLGQVSSWDLPRTGVLLGPSQGKCPAAPHPWVDEPVSRWSCPLPGPIAGLGDLLEHLWVLGIHRAGGVRCPHLRGRARNMKVSPEHLQVTRMCPDLMPQG